MARSRKLFPSYGSALATNLLSALGRDGFVQGFVSAYVAEYDRPGILGGPARNRELEETIGREVTLAMLDQLRHTLPQFFGKKRLASLNEAEKQAISAFLHELMDTLDRVWGWDGEDRRQFRRDLALYGGLTNPPAKAAAPGRNRRKVQDRAKQDEDPPFVGRVALLLDPSMIDQARRAARKFYVQTERLTRSLLRQTLRPAR